MKTGMIRVSLEDDLNESVCDAAGPSGVSHWLADAARFRSNTLYAVANEIAAETGGPLIDDEPGEARNGCPRLR